MAEPLPTADEFFGQPTTQDNAPQGRLPTADEFFAPPKPSALGLTIDAMRAPSQYQDGNYVPNPAVQNFLKGTAVGRIMSAFNSGIEEQTQTPPGLSDDTINSLRKSGFYNDYAKGENDFGRAITEGIVTPAAYAMDVAGRVGVGAFNASMAAIGQAAEELPKPLSELAEYALNSPIGAEFHAPEALPKPIAEAKSAGVLESDEVFSGIKEPTPQQAVAMHDAATQVKQELPEEEPAPAVPDIHQAARNIAPEVFDQYDRLTVSQEGLRNSLSYLNEQRQREAIENAPHNEEIADLQAKLDDANARKTKIYQAKIDELTEANNKAIQEARQTDTPEMAQIRQSLQDIDYKIRDLAPDVSAAYRKAQEGLPDTESTSSNEVRATPSEKNYTIGQDGQGGHTVIDNQGRVLSENEETGEVSWEKNQNKGSSFLTADEASKAADKATHNEKESADFEKELQVRRQLEKDADNGKITVEELNRKLEELSSKYNREGTAEVQTATNPIHTPEMLAAIAQDASDKIAAAGRPREEADAAAQLVAEHYAARAERFGGAKGTAEDMYHSDMATIKAGRTVKSKPRELAQAQGFADRDTIKFRKDLDDLDKGKLNPKSVLHIGETPEIISRVGGNEGKLVISPSVVKKIEGGKHAISRTITSRLKSLLADPIAVFDSGTNDGDIVAAVSVKDANGHPVIVPVRIGKENGTNVVTSVYGKENAAWFKDQVDAGRLRYLNTKKASELPGVPEPNVQVEATQKPDKSILTEKDFVNKDAQNSANNELNQSARGKIRLATDDAKAAITLMKDANASTFIHEVGHHWLDELSRDALDPRAPQDLIQDHKTVMDWLGVKDGEDIPTRAHEKFARGFERYLMEGTAPSKQLAGVFAKFKQWLTQIYNTVNSLRSPINDDIRDVFDRLLSKNSEKTVIAPEHEAGKMMADIHEADAEHTAPEKAAPVADNVNKERTDIEEKNNVDTSTKNSSSSAGVSQPEPTDAGSKPAAGTGGFTQEPSAVGSGGNQTAPESDGLRSAEPQPSTAAGGASNGAGSVGTPSPEKPSPEQQRTDPRAGTAEILGPPKSDLLDKAGNIRLDNLNAPESVNEVIRQIAAENNDFSEARGVVSDDQVMRLADSLGIPAAEVNLKKISAMMGPGQLAAKIMAARKLLIQSATELRDAMAKAATGSDEDVMAYAEAKERHIMIQQQVSGVTAEAGRALRAFRNIEGSAEAQAVGDFLKQATGKDLFQLKAEAKLGASLDTAEKVSKFIQDSKKPSFGDMVLEYWINGLISGPATHTTYAIGNTLLGLWKAIPETAVASLVGKVREAVTGEKAAVKLGEVGANLKGVSEGLSNAVSASGQALKTGLTTLLPGEEASAQAFGGKGIPGAVGNEAVSWEKAGADAFGAVKGLRDAFIATGDLVQSGSIPDFEVGKIRIPLGSAIRVPARAISAIHSFFRTVNYSMDKSAIAYRTATDEGLVGNDFAARVGDIVTNPSEEVMKQARGTATNLTLMGEGGEFTKAISKLTNVSVNLPLLGQTKLLKFIDPFVHIGSNVIDQSIIQRTPLGLLSPQIRADLSGVNGAVARDFAASRMIVGSALVVTIGGLAAEGLVSGSGPSDPKEASAWKLLGGNQPHSIKIGDVWYDTHRLGPLGMLTGISADLYDVAHAIGHEDATKVGSMLVHAITQNILDESFMKGPSDLIKALTDSDRYGDAYLRTFISSFVPFSVGLSQSARAVDPYTRQTRTVMDAIKDKIPFVSEGLYPRRDVWGQPIANKEVLGPAGFSAIYENRINKDPVNQQLLKLGVFPSQPERKIRGVELTDQQYDDFCKIAGKTAKARLDAVVPNPGFANLPESAQIDIIKETIKTSRESASSIIMMRNPNIIQQATSQKIKAFSGKP